MDFSQLMGMAGGHAEARAIQTGLKLGLFNALRERELDAAPLATAIGCDRRATMLLGNALAAIGLLTQSDGRYRLTEPALRFLLQSSPEYLGDMILFDEALWETWGRLDEAVRTGQPARAADMYQSRPEETARFIRAMDSLVRARGDAGWTADKIDLSGVRTLADIGGGPGTYLIEFLRRWPELRGIIFDLPATLNFARPILREAAPSMLQRIELRELDYNREEIPGPLDVIFMSNIIHSEDEAANASLIAKSFRALETGGALIIKDHIMDTALVSPQAGAVFSLYLLLTTRGRDYSFDEVGGWMRAAGFTDIAIEMLPSPPFSSSLVLAHKRPTGGHGA
jgi:SAM-dependent methyltransferase